LADRELHVVAELVEPLGHAHFTISLSSNIGHGLFQPRDVAETPDGKLAGGAGIQTARDELPRPHLDVQPELLLDLLIDRDAPEPRTRGTLHLENRTFETPAENRRHVAVSAASC